MLGYAFRRVLLIVPVVVGGITILFLLFFVIPSDPATLAAAGNGKAVNPVTREQVTKQYELDKPVAVQYVHYWGRVLHWDLGKSYQDGRTVNSIIGDTAPNSVRLAFWAILIEALVGISAGIVSAVRKYTFLDVFATVSTTMALAIPAFVLGFILQWIFGITSRDNGWPSFLQFQVEGSPAHWNVFFFPAGDGWRYLVLPAITLACVNTAVVARMARTTMIEVQDADYMRTARAKGLSERVVTMKHGLRNALIPVVTLIGMDIGNLMGAAVVTETLFSWPGMGREIARRAEAKDAPVVLGLTLVLILVYVVASLVVDLSYGFLDPRIRYGKEAR